MGSDFILDVLVERLGGRFTNNGAQLLCPCHDDNSPSLSASLTDEGVVLLHCFAGCSYEDVRERIADIGIELSKTYKDSYLRASQPKLQAVPTPPETRKNAEKIWRLSSNIDANNFPNYLTTKKINKAFCSRVINDSKGFVKLIVPMVDEQNELAGLQLIDATGFKKFLLGTKVKGLVAILEASDPQKQEIYITEGYATGCSVALATGAKVVVAFACFNLEATVKRVLRTFVREKVVICGDDDVWSSNNPGRTKAEKIADEHGIQVVFPSFPADKSDKKFSDFNDLHATSGLEEVARQISLVKPVVTRNESIWPDPKQIAPSPTAPDLNRGHLPEILDNFVHDTAARMRVNPEVPAIFCLGVIASLIGKKFCLLPLREDKKWVVYPTVWALVVGSPGMKKTPVLDRVLKPLKDLERGYNEEFKTAFSKWLVHEKIGKIELGKLSEALKKTKDDAHKNQIFNSMLDLEKKLKATQPQRRRLFLNDATTQKIAIVLSENENGLLLSYDEAVGLIESFSMRGREGDREFYLSSWGGVHGHNIDRVERGSILVPFLKLNIVGTTQPNKIEPIIKNIKTGGRQDDGLLHRFNFVYPEKKYFDRPTAAESVTAESKFSDFIKWLVDVRPTFDQVNSQYTFSSEAQKIYNEWDNQNQKLFALGKNPHYIESILAKHTALVTSLALIFQVAKAYESGKSTTEISVESLNSALFWQRFLFEHAKKLFRPDVDDAHIRASAIADKIKSGEVYDGMSLRELYRKNWANLKTAREVEIGTLRLRDYGWVKIEEKRSDRGAPSELLRINPKLMRTNVE